MVCRSAVEESLANPRRKSRRGVYEIRTKKTGMYLSCGSLFPQVQWCVGLDGSCLIQTGAPRVLKKTDDKQAYRMGSRSRSLENKDLDFVVDREIIVIRDA